MLIAEVRFPIKSVCKKVRFPIKMGLEKVRFPKLLLTYGRSFLLYIRFFAMLRNLTNFAERIEMCNYILLQEAFRALSS